MKPTVLLLLTACASGRGAGQRARNCPLDRAAELGLQEDVVKLAGCTVLQGITIRTGASIDVAPLSELEEITGDLSIGPTVAVDEAAFNSLLHVGGTIRVASNSALRGLFFPRIERIGRAEIENNAMLTTISLPRLTNVDGALVIADNGGLELISAPLLATVGKELVIAGHRRLNLVEMSHVTSVETIRIEGNPSLPGDVVDKLTSASTVKPESAPAKPPTP
jgi:hypothetical protein